MAARAGSESAASIRAGCSPGASTGPRQRSWRYLSARRLVSAPSPPESQEDREQHPCRRTSRRRAERTPSNGGAPPIAAMAPIRRSAGASQAATCRVTLRLRPTGGGHNLRCARSGHSRAAVLRRAAARRAFLGPPGRTWLERSATGISGPTRPPDAPASTPWMCTCGRMPSRAVGESGATVLIALVETNFCNDDAAPHRPGQRTDRRSDRARRSRRSILQQCAGPVGFSHPGRYLIGRDARSAKALTG